MTWETDVSRKVNNMLYQTAWRKAQKTRARVEKLVQGFFEELVTVGVDVLEAPQLGAYTPEWEPLTEDWLARKTTEGFYFDTGNLERTLLRKNPTAVFGRPQIWLDWNGGTRKVNAGEIAQKFQGQKLTGLRIRVIPFPKVENWNAEALVAGGDDNTTFYKLVNPKGNRLRPLVTPFLQWYVHVKVKNAMKGLVA